jgi:hypothetical protein
MIERKNTRGNRKHIEEIDEFDPAPLNDEEPLYGGVE